MPTASSVLLVLPYAAAALAAITALVAGFVRSPGFGFGLICTGQAWQAVSPGSVPSLGTALDITFLDLVAVCALFAAAVCAARGPLAGPALARRALLALLCFLLVSVPLGAAVSGAGAAGNDARTYFVHVVATACYAATAGAGRDVTRPLFLALLTLSGLVTLHAVLVWGRHGIGSSATRVLVDGQIVNGRPVDSASALIVAVAAVMALCLCRRLRNGLLLASPLLLVVLLLQHRTVWVAAAVMTAGWLLLRPRTLLDKAVTAVAAAAVMAAGIAVALALPEKLPTQHLAESASDGRTWQWRVDGWVQLLGRLQDAGDWLFGLPFGSGYARLAEGGVVVDVSPHNYYLHLLLRVGLLGLALLAVCLASALRSADRATPQGLLTWLLVAGLGCYALAYAPVLAHGLLLGLAARGGGQPPDQPSARSVRTAANSRPASGRRRTSLSGSAGAGLAGTVR